MGRHCRRGSAIAEASIVLPIIILSVLACVLFCVFSCRVTAQQCCMHAEIRREAVLLTGRGGDISTGLTWDGACRTGRRGLFQCVTGKETITMQKQGIMARHVSAGIEGVWYAADGVSFVRHSTLVRKRTAEGEAEDR